MLIRKLGFIPVKQTMQFTVLFDRKRRYMAAWIFGLAFGLVLGCYVLVRVLWP